MKEYTPEPQGGRVGTGDALASARLFNEIQNKIYQLQPINGSLDKL